jgi:galactonate dehydratase
MKITKLETFMVGAGIRNWLFLKLHTDCGIVGVGEASMEWRENAIETLLHEFLEELYIIGANPFDIEPLYMRVCRDGYWGGPVMITALSGIEMACWDIIGKALGQPVYNLLGGRCRNEIKAYANGWYGGERTPENYAQQAKKVVAMGYEALKFDPFGTAWKEMNHKEKMRAISLVEAVRDAVGDEVEILIEVHGRLSVAMAVEMAHELEKFKPAWYEEPVDPQNLESLAEVKNKTNLRIAAGERLHILQDFFRLISLRAADVIQLDVAHCGGILAAKKITAMASAQDLLIAPHNSVGPISTAAALHLDTCTTNFMIQESYDDFDVPWRSDIVNGWKPVVDGKFMVPECPGLGVELNDDAMAEHPPIKNPFPSLWEDEWIRNFTQR